MASSETHIPHGKPSLSKAWRLAYAKAKIIVAATGMGNWSVSHSGDRLLAAAQIFLQIVSAKLSGTSKNSSCFASGTGSIQSSRWHPQSQGTSGRGVSDSFGAQSKLSTLAP